MLSTGNCLLAQLLFSLIQNSSSQRNKQLTLMMKQMEHLLPPYLTLYTKEMIDEFSTKGTLKYQ